MTDGIRFKICGLTRREDAEAAVHVGADYLGFILHPDSPRYISLEKFRDFAGHLPKGRKVAVSVEPTLDQLKAMDAAGFDLFQLHFRHDTPVATVASWVETVGSERAWLAPKLPPESAFPSALLPLTKVFFFDTFHIRKFGGTGEPGDWVKYAHYKRKHPKKTWILSGGLTPANIVAALKATRARFVDLSSGVESAPGVKDPAKLKLFVERLHDRRG